MQEKPPFLSCLRERLGTLGGEPPHSTSLPVSFYFNYFTLETNLSKPGYLNHTAQAPIPADRCWAWWPIISALGRQRQENCPEFTGSLDYRVRLCHKNTK